MSEPVHLAENTVFAVNPNQCIWGADAQQRWRELETQTLTRSGGRVLVSDPAVADHILHDPDGFTSADPMAHFLGSGTGLIPLQTTGDAHRRYRKLLDPLFAPKRVKLLEPDVVVLANECIDGFIERGHCDFSQEFAVPLPCGIFLRTMGLSLEHLGAFIDIKDQIIRPQGRDDAERNAVRQEAGDWLAAFFTEALDGRKSAPPEGTDVLGYLCSLEAAGELNREETLNICHQLIIAGLDTVTDALECGFAFLATSPDHQRQLANDPDLVIRAAEELLRYTSPVPNVTRTATADTDLGGCPVKEGDLVHTLLATTNLSDAVVPRADVVDFDRDSFRHIGFGVGLHRCLGSHLARVELRIGLREWHRRIPSYRLAEGSPVLFAPALREIPHLQLEFTPADRESSA